MIRARMIEDTGSICVSELEHGIVIELPAGYPRHWTTIRREDVQSVYDWLGEYLARQSTEAVKGDE